MRRITKAATIAATALNALIATGTAAGTRRRARSRSKTAPERSPVRVLYLFPESYLNTPWSVIATILQHADERDILPLVVLDDNTGGALGFDEAQIPVVRLRLTGRLRARAAVRLRRLVLDNDIDVVHIVDSGPSLLSGALLSVVSRTPLVIHFHSIPELWGFKKRMTLRAITICTGAAVVGVSEFVRLGVEQHIGIDPKALTYVHNGVDVDRFHPDVDGDAMRASLGFSPTAIAVVQPARFWSLKKQDDLVRALAIARRRNPAIELALIGWDDTNYSGPFPSHRAEIEALAAELGVSHAVRCHEPNTRCPEIHAAADIVCLPSIAEPFGLVAIEAQAAGRAFVGADSGALRELVEDGVDGLLVPPNSPEALAEALVELAADPGLRARLGRAGRTRVRGNFDCKLLAPRFAAVYRAVVAGAPTPPASPTLLALDGDTQKRVVEPKPFKAAARRVAPAPSEAA